MQASASSGPIHIYEVHITFEGSTVLFLLWHKRQNFSKIFEYFSKAEVLSEIKAIKLLLGEKKI